MTRRATDSGTNAPGIGAGNDTMRGTVNLRGGTVTLTGGEGSGIYSGQAHTGGAGILAQTIAVTGGSVRLFGGAGGSRCAQGHQG